jgi:hypothetical protein
MLEGLQVMSNNNAPFQIDFFEVGAADLFWKSRPKRRLIQRASGADMRPGPGGIGRRIDLDLLLRRGRAR